MHKWNNGDAINIDIQQQKVLCAKLKKLKAFLDGLKGDSHTKQNQKEYVNVDVETEKLNDAKTEIETMIQMTYVKINYE